MPNREQVKLSVDGMEFYDFTSIWVQRTWGNAYDQFKFSCAERDGASASEVQSSARFQPGSKCKVELAGKIAMQGYIITRQVAYDANSHAVQLLGTNQSWAPATSGIDHPTNSFDGMKFDQIAEEVVKKAGGTVEWNGKKPEHKFTHVHTEQGETVFDFLKRLAANVNVIVTCDKKGNMLFVGEEPQTKTQGQLIEGVNILKMQCVFTKERSRGKYIVHGSTPATSKTKKMMQPAAEQIDDSVKDDDAPWPDRVQVLAMEQPTDEENTVKKRGETELMWDKGSQLNATIVVQGWQPEGGSGDLWEPGSTVFVKSPMAMLNMQLSIQSVTYTQDNNSGSLTTLVCVGPGSLPKKKY